jgi:hypothetical protein
VRVITYIDENTTAINNGPKILFTFRESTGIIATVTEEHLDLRMSTRMDKGLSRHGIKRREIERCRMTLADFIDLKGSP